MVLPPKDEWEKGSLVAISQVPPSFPTGPRRQVVSHPWKLQVEKLQVLHLGRNRLHTRNLPRDEKKMASRLHHLRPPPSCPPLSTAPHPEEGEHGCILGRPIQTTVRRHPVPAVLESVLPMSDTSVPYRPWAVSLPHWRQFQLLDKSMWL